MVQEALDAEDQWSDYWSVSLVQGMPLNGSWGEMNN